MKVVKYLFTNLETSLLTIFFVLFSFGQLQRIQLTNDTAFYLHDLVIILFIGWSVISDKKIQLFGKKITTVGQKIINDYRLELVWGGWILWGMAVGGVMGRLEITSFLYFFRLLTYLGFVGLLMSSHKINYPPRKGFLVAGGLIGFWGLLQYSFFPDTRFLYIFGWDNHYYRLISTLLDPAFTGMILVMTWGFWINTKILSSSFIRFKKLVQILLIVTIAATFSRATYLAWLVLSLTLTLAKKISLQTLLISLLIFVTALLFLPKPGGEGVNLSRTSTISARYQNAQQSLVKLNNWEWLWGRGLFNTDVQQDYQTPSHAQLPDSLPVLLLNTTGLGGIGLATLVGIKWFKKWWQKDPLWSSVFLAVITHSLFNNTFLQPFIFLMLWGSKKTN